MKTKRIIFQDNFRRHPIDLVSKLKNSENEVLDIMKREYEKGNISAEEADKIQGVIFAHVSDRDLIERGCFKVIEEAE